MSKNKWCLTGMGGILVLLQVLLLHPCLSFAAEDFQAGRAAFQLKVNGIRLTHNISFRTVMPLETLWLENPNMDQVLSIKVDGNEINFNQNTIKWQAPAASGLVKFEIMNKAGVLIQLQVFVLKSAAAIQNGSLNGYRIGQYPAPLRGLEAYLAPRGFIEVQPHMLNLPISPHFSLGQFLCKQEGAFPKYLVLRPKLLEKLEHLLEDVNSHGIRTDGFVIMSGYRTPYYNKAIGNVPNSRHIYGGAADVFIDVKPKDNLMDDLNKDGKFTEQDAAFLYELFDSFVARNGRPDLIGGIGQYAPTVAHGAFVHVDVRGTKARWGH